MGVGIECCDLELATRGKGLGLGPHSVLLVEKMMGSTVWMSLLMPAVRWKETRSGVSLGGHCSDPFPREDDQGRGVRGGAFVPG